MKTELGFASIPKTEGGFKNWQVCLAGKPVDEVIRVAVTQALDGASLIGKGFKVTTNITFEAGNRINLLHRTHIQVVYKKSIPEVEIVDGEETPVYETVETSETFDIYSTDDGCTYIYDSAERWKKFFVDGIIQKMRNDQEAAEKTMVQAEKRLKRINTSFASLLEDADRS